MADGRQVISTGETPTAAKLNKIARRVVIDCTSSTHPSSPAALTHVAESDTGLLKVFDGTAYQTYPLGILDWGTLSGQVLTGSLATAAGASVVFDAVQDQLYEYRVDLRVQSATADDGVNVQMEVNDGSGYVSQESVRTIVTHNSSFAYSHSISTVWAATVTATGCAFRSRVSAISGAGTLHVGTTARVAHMGLRL